AGDLWREARAHRGPIGAVHLRIVEPVALPTPRLLEHTHARGEEVVGHRAGGRHTAHGATLHVHRADATTVVEPHLTAIWRPHDVVLSTRRGRQLTRRATTP